MRRVIIAMLIQALALAGAGVSFSAPAGAQASHVASPSPEQLTLKLLNIERRHAGLPLLEWNAQLAQAAQAHSRLMGDHEDLSHRFPGEPELTERVSMAGARFNALAENVAVAADPQEAHIALMNSPGHRANILNPEYNAVGVAIVWIDGDMYVTEDFARIVRTYTADQFRGAVVTAFNHARQGNRMAALSARSDPQLDHAACSGQLDPQLVLKTLPGATQATVFTASQPDELPPPMEKAAADSSLSSMKIGVCFRMDPGDKVSKFWVVAAFYPGKSAAASGSASSSGMLH